MAIEPPSRARRLLPASLAVLAGVVGAALVPRPATPAPVAAAGSWHLEVRPLEATNPVRTQQLFIATVYDDKGVPRRNRRVDWVLEGAGAIVKVDDSGLLFRGHKIDSRSAVSYTAFSEHLHTRGNLDPGDDFMIRPGQTWIMVSSAVEGDTHITATAADVENWENCQVVVTTHWVDAGWRLPPPVVARAGTPHVCSTQLYRPANQQPLAGYRVRYRILDGPPALFLPGRKEEEVAVADASGAAGVTLVQTEPRAGTTRVAVEILRPTEAGAAVVGQGETRVDWQGPQISLTNTVPPAVPLGQEVPVTLNVSNTGQVECQEITLRDVVPEGLQFVRSDPPAIVEGNQLIWTLPALPAGRGHTVQAVFKSARPGPFQLTSSVRTHEGLSEAAKASTEVTVPKLALAVAAPETGVLGVPVRYDITVSNPGTGAAGNVLLVADFDAGLEHDTRANPLRLPVGALAPGESRVVALTLTPRQAGTLTNRLAAAGDGNLNATAQHAIAVKKAQLAIDLKGADKSYQNRPVDWTITAENKGELPLTNVLVHDPLPPELALVSAEPPAWPGAGEIAWNLGTLQPGERREVKLKTQCVRLAPRARHVVVATAEPGLRVQAEAPLEIDGVAAFDLQVHDTTDPVAVGGRTSYRIDVLNQGTLAGTRVEVVAVVPAEFKILNAVGTGQARFDGNRIAFPAVDALGPGQRITYTVDVQAVQAGDARFRAELRAATLAKEIVTEESTTVYGAGATPRP